MTLRFNKSLYIIYAKLYLLLLSIISYHDVQMLALYSFYQFKGEVKKSTLFTLIAFCFLLLLLLLRWWHIQQNNFRFLLSLKLKSNQEFLASTWLVTDTRLTITCEQALHLGTSWDVTRDRRREIIPLPLAASPLTTEQVLARLTLLDTWDGELARRL